MLGGTLHAQAAGAAVVINEVECETDWVELVDTSGSEADLSGWLLTDDPLDRDPPRDSHRLILPTNTEIPAGDELVVEKGDGGLPFGISCGNDTIRLADETGTLVDEVEVPELTADTETWGRYPNGSGDFVQTAPTKGAPNEPSTATGEPGEDLAAWLFDPTAVVEIELGLPLSSREALATEPNTYQDGTFALTTTGGSHGPLDVGIRLKGGLGSGRTLEQKAAFKVKFSHSVGGQRFFGLKTLTLNNMVQDPSQLHETLAYEAFRAMGVAAPRTGFAYVRVDGADYGLYLNVEEMDDISLPRWFDSTQHLYEGEYGADVVPGELDQFEVDEGSESDLSDLEALIEASRHDLWSGPGLDWSDGVSQIVDLEQMTRMWAVEKYIGHWDGYAGNPGPLHPNNYYLHSDDAGRFSMLPWGTDQTWVFRIGFQGDTGHLFHGCMLDAGCARMYRDAVYEARDVIAGLGLDSRAESTADLLFEWQQLDPRREHSLVEIEAWVGALRDFLAVRPGDVANPAYWDPVDTVAPQTRIAAGPRGVVRVRRPRARARFTFRSNEPGAVLECRLDRGPWTTCRSPLKTMVGLGRHRLRVRARDLAGNVDLSPASRSWRVKRARGKRRAPRGSRKRRGG